MQPFCFHINSGSNLSVSVIEPRKIKGFNLFDLTRGLVAGMPNYKVSDYFDRKQKGLADSDFIVSVQDAVSKQTVALLVASWHQKDVVYLNIKTLLIAEKWQRSRAIHLAWRGLFQAILELEQQFPPIIVFKTMNPRSFVAMNAFRNIPGAIVYPSLLTQPTPLAVTDIARKIAAELSPGREFNDSTGVISGGADGVVDFYSEVPRSGVHAIDTHFASFVTPCDRLLACLFTGGHLGESKILKAFGVKARMDTSLT